MQQISQSQNQPSLGHLHSASWKQKIGFLDQLSQQIKLQELAFSPQLLENIWLDFIKENNLNVLQKAITTLRTWVQVYGVKSVRVQRELVKNIISLSKMGRAQIDQSIVSIVIALFSRETQEATVNQRKPLAMIDLGSFNSSNNPTFLAGYDQSQSMEQQNNEETEPQIIQEAPRTSLILRIVVESMRTCQKHSFALCLKILASLIELSQLTSQQITEISAQVMKISQVIENRRLPNPEVESKEKKLDEEIAFLVKDFKKLEQ